ALALEPGSQIALLYRVAALRGLGRFQDARGDLDVLRALNPQSTLPQVELAYLQLFEGNAAAAENAFQ
ncbi:MAG TPA: hypothetical protein DEH78_04460, partial [Solibacterales bacterium]|nr:hypothetical protein [Bryobacterales bacterium]